MVKLMVVDKCPLQGQAFENILKKYRPNISYVGQAFSGRTGLELAQKKDPNIIFTDILLPEMDGLMMSKKLRELYPQLLIVILTALDDFDLVENALRIGVNDYKLKPISHKGFLTVVDKLNTLINNSNSSITQLPQQLPAHQFTLYNKIFKTIKTGTNQQIYILTDNIFSELNDKTGGELNQMRTQLIKLTAEIVSIEQNNSLNNLLTIIYKQFLNDIISAQGTECLLTSFNTFIQNASSIYNQNNCHHRFEIISQIQETIETRLNENITLESIANEMFFTTSYLSRLFKKHTGRNFSDYLIDRRLERAKLLLLSTNRTVDSIAQEVGYDNANSFRRLFKSKIGISATEYRSSHRR